MTLLSSRPDLFDGQTTLMLTADHGMFESSGGSITQDEILAKLETAGLRRPRVTIANRAVFLHGVRPGELHATENALKALFKAKAMDAQFIAQTHTTYQELISDRESPPPGLPDLFILLRDEGLAVTRPIAAPMLHYGGHGGCSAEEVFVPCVTVVLTPNLSAALTERYGRLA